MSHFVTLQLYYDTANAWKDRPAVLEDVETPKPAPKPTPTKPIEEKPKPVAPIVPDHEVEANRVPSTFPTNVKGELKYQKDNSQVSTYSNLFEKDVTVEKVGDKYKYTFKVKEAKGNTFVTKRTNYQFSKITHNGTEATLTPLEGTTKQVSLLADKLFDKLQLKTTVVTKQDKQGSEIDTTLELDFPAVEKNVENPYYTVPTTLLDASLEKPSMGNGALLGDKTRVEKIGDTYHYYVTFKDLQFAGLTGSVDNLKVNGQAADAKDLGGELNEKQYHFTSSDKLTVTPVTIDVLVGGKPFHKNTPARISFNWDKATSLTEEAVNKLHADETAKAEAVKLAKEKAEKEKAEAERLAKEKAEKEKAEAERLAKEKAEKEKAEKEKAEAERLAKEKAEKEKAEAERLAKEKAEKEKAEAERLAKEKAEKEKAEKEKAEAERLAKEKAEKEKNQPAYFSNPKVTFNEDKSLATFADNDGDTPVKVTIPTAGLENDVYELEVVKVTVPGLDSNNEVYDIHFVTKDGKVRQIKQPASIKVPVERKVISAYHIDKDGANKQNIENFSNVKENNVNYVVIEAKHFSLYGFEYENTSAQPVKPQPSTNEKEVKPQPNINESEVNKPTQTSIQNNKTPKTVLNNKNITNNSIVVKNNKKELPKTGINSSSVIGLGFIALLSALLLNRKRNN